jgi:hypothetical protein
MGLLSSSISGFLRHLQTEESCTVSVNTKVDSFLLKLGRQEPSGNDDVFHCHSKYSPGRVQILCEHSYSVHTDLSLHKLPVPGSDHI